MLMIQENIHGDDDDGNDDGDNDVDEDDTHTTLQLSCLR